LASAASEDRALASAASEDRALVSAARLVLVLAVHLALDLGCRSWVD